MGADLYIDSVYQANMKKYNPLFEAAARARNEAKHDKKLEADLQKIVTYFYEKTMSEGYFRDSYNDSSLFKTLDLSWWQLSREGVINKKGKLMPTKAKALLKIIESKDEMKLPKGDSEWSDDEIKEYFEEKKARFIAFLKQAIELKEPIECSV